MAVRVKKYSSNGVGQSEDTGQETKSTDFTTRETTVDGQTFAWHINEVRNFLDDGVGAAHAAFGAIGTIEDTVAFGSSRS